MKTISIIILYFTVIAAYAQEIQIGEEVPTLEFQLIDKQQAIHSYKAKKGTALLIDFWASWCSPCIENMPHLESLKEKFEGKLEVIVVSQEKVERISRFIRKKPFKFLFAQDTGELRAYFPYQVIPHSVLIAPSGQLVAISSPENITENVISAVLRGEKIDLPIKKDHFQFDPTAEYFQFDEAKRELFQLQPFMSGIPSFSKSYYDGKYKNRRLTIFNLNVEGLYRKAYNISTYRMVYEFDEALIDWENKENRYCLNVVVDDPERLYSYMQEQLPLHTNVSAVATSSKIKVLVISKSDGIAKLKPASVAGSTQARGDHFKNKGASISEFCNYLEGFGIVGMAVVDETNDDQLYDIDFSFDPEDPASFNKAMNELGLGYEVAERETEVLILSLKE